MQIRQLTRFIGAMLMAGLATTSARPPQACDPQRPSEWWHQRHDQKVAEANEGEFDVVLIGDSITQYAERDPLYGYYFGNRRVLNLGFGGDGTEHALWRLRNGELDGVEPKLVSLMIGTNNARNQSAEAIVAGIEAILDELRTRVPKAKVLLFSVFPRKAGKEQSTLEAVNRELPRLGQRKQVELVDISAQFYTADGKLNADLYYTDLLHLSTEGYQVWWAELERHFSKSLNEPALPAHPHRAIQSAPRGGPRHDQKVQEAAEGGHELIFVGDSITHFWERDGEFGMPVWDRYYGHRKALNLGFGGDRTEWVNWRLQNGEVKNLDPKLVVLMIGTNNTHVTQDPPEETLAGIASNLRTIRHHLPNAKVLLLSIFPRGKGPDDPLRKINEAVNSRLPELAEDDPSVTHLNINDHFLDEQGRLSRKLLPDLLHPNTRGYKVWAAAMEPTLSRLLGDDAIAPSDDGFDATSFRREWVPEPVFEKEPGYVDLYWKAWEQAFDHLASKDGIPQTPYMDEAFSDSHIWIWDTCFMVLFCKYSPDHFPGVETLNNFYEAFHSDKYRDGSFPLGIRHPDNPPLFAWAEHGNYLFTGDDDHARNLLTETKYLQKHFEWFDQLKSGWQFDTKEGPSAEVTLVPGELGYGWTGCSSGMDNTPRHREALWLDAIAQQGLSALAIQRMAERLGEAKIAAEWKSKYEAIRSKVNDHYWDDKDGIYYDISKNGETFHKVKTPASYWPMLAEMCSPEQAERMVKHITDPEIFGGDRPWVTVARNDPNFDATDGAYWRGGIWLPTAYMGTKALEKYGYRQEADETAEKLLAQMYRTYRDVEPNTIWECYSPSRDHPVVRKNGHIVRQDFCGWSALGPISMFIENVMGFHTVDAKNQRIEWRLHQAGRHGLKNFKFGSTVADIVYDGGNQVRVHSNQPFDLVINGTTHAVGVGNTVLSVAKQK